MNTIDTSVASRSGGAGRMTLGRRRLVLAAAALLALAAREASAKGGSSVSVTTTSAVSGTVVSGAVTIANSGSKTETVSAVTSWLEVRYASGVTPPALPPGSASGWYVVATASLPAPGPIAAGSTRTIPFSIDTCRAGVAPYGSAKDMRSAATVSAGQTYDARSLSYALPGKCPVCGNGIVESGEACDEGGSIVGCCSATCQFRANGSQCNDGNGCTQLDQCQTGRCVGGDPVNCSASDQCHSAGTCNPATGLCSNPAAPNGSACNDQNACTRTDSCQSGFCRGADAVTCDAGDACQQASCDPSTGTCSSQPRADGTECIDGDACTVGDHCVGGSCVSGAGRDCNDRLSCTDDACDAATGCQHDATPTCDGCDADECVACGDACNTQHASCESGCWTSFMGCLSHCTTTYCAPFCQVDLGRCIANCPAVDGCQQTCETGNGCAAGCVDPG